jgi:hypothetical protein
MPSSLGTSPASLCVGILFQQFSTTTGALSLATAPKLATTNVDAGNSNLGPLLQTIRGLTSAARHLRAASHICSKSSTASQASLQQAHCPLLCNSKSSTPVSRPFLKSSTHTFLYFSFSFSLYPLVLNSFSSLYIRLFCN